MGKGRRGERNPRRKERERREGGREGGREKRTFISDCLFIRNWFESGEPGAEWLWKQLAGPLGRVRSETPPRSPCRAPKVRHCPPEQTARPSPRQHPGPHPRAPAGQRGPLQCHRAPGSPSISRAPASAAGARAPIPREGGAHASSPQLPAPQEAQRLAVTPGEQQRRFWS